VKNVFFQYWYYLLIAATIAFGLAFPDSGRIIKDYNLLNIGIFLSFFATGLELDTISILAKKGNFRGLLAGIISHFVLFPALAFAAAKIFFGNNQGLFVGICLLSAVPVTMITATVLTKIAGGNTALSLLINVATNMLAVFTVPWTMKLLLAHAEIHLPAAEIMNKIFVMVILPVILGQSGRWILGHSVRKYKREISVFCRFIILLIILNAVANSADKILLSANQVVLVMTAMIGLHGIVLLMNYEIAALLKLDPHSRFAFTITASQKTLGLSFIVWSGFFSSFTMAMLPIICYHLTQSITDAWLANNFAKKHKGKPDGIRS